MQTCISGYSAAFKALTPDSSIEAWLYDSQWKHLRLHTPFRKPVPMPKAL